MKEAVGNVAKLLISIGQDWKDNTASLRSLNKWERLAHGQRQNGHITLQTSSRSQLLRIVFVLLGDTNAHARAFGRDCDHTFERVNA